jgi:hypothetical protein
MVGNPVLLSSCLYQVSKLEDVQSEQNEDLFCLSLQANSAIVP